MCRILFLIRSLEPGGAERQLVELVKGLDKSRFEITVATFYRGGELREEINRLEGITVLPLMKKERWDLLPFLWRLWQVTRAIRPDILHGYMSLANELCLLVGRPLGVKVVWGLRSSNVDFSKYDWISGLAFRVGAWLSRFPDLIIVNSRAGQQHHAAHGYSLERMVVIPNGIDTERYRPDHEAGRRVRAEWGVADQTILIGLVARLDPMKDHATFLRAAAALVCERPQVRFVCVGDGPGAYKQELLALSDSLGLWERLIWADFRSDMPAVYNALDIAVSSSYGEGFSNAIGEAMACGVPCVVTDVGDSARIVGDTGVLVPPRDPEALRCGIESCLAHCADPAVRRRARQRIVQEFSRARLASTTAQALEKLL